MSTYKAQHNEIIASRNCRFHWAATWKYIFSYLSIDSYKLCLMTIKRGQNYTKNQMYAIAKL